MQFNTQFPKQTESQTYLSSSSKQFLNVGIIESHYRRDAITWGLNDTLEEWVTRGFRGEIKRLFEANENGNTTEPQGYSENRGEENL